jgi:hypothetical protein
MNGKKLFSVLFLLLVLVSAGAGCGGDTSQTISGATGTTELAWNAPATYADGTPLTNLAGYKIYYGTTSGNYTSVLFIGNVTNYTLTLPVGTYYFTVSSYDSLGSESGFSNEVSKTIL